MELFGKDPGRRAVVLFLAAIAVGTVLLSLPVSSGGEDSVSLINALFTATSAVCVTGLTVVDTGTAFSRFGQIVILVLIQLGGLGIMTFATGLLLSLGSRLSFQDRLGLSQSLGLGSTRSLLLAVMATTFVVEIAGAALLFLRFRTQFSLPEAVWYSVFHAVSAFCNAGFSLFPDSLEGYRNDPFVLLTVATLIIFGGLGFAVVRELYERFTAHKAALSLHSKLCLATTGILLVMGTVALLAAEHRNSFSANSWSSDLLNAFFQSVTARTAGFNALPQRGLTELGILVTMALMFIGACPGSTGGGIKTTTIAAIGLMMYSRYNGRTHVSAFHRSFSNESLIRAVTVFLLAVTVIFVMFALLMFSEERAVSHQLSHGWFVDNLFETISAFGTVGLSLGGTPHYSGLAKVILAATMFIGRVGLLTLAFSMARPMKPGEIVYSEETVMVG